MLKIERYNISPNAWSVTPGKIASETIERGKNKGKPNPQSGQIIWKSTETKYPGTVTACARRILDFAIKDKVFEVYNEDDLRKMIMELEETMELFVQKIEQVLVTADNFVLKDE